MELPSSLALVEERAFQQTAAEAVILPEGASVDHEAFLDGAVRVLMLPGVIGEIAEDAFTNCPLRVVVCPRGSQAWAWAEDHGLAVRQP